MEPFGKRGWQPVQKIPESWQFVRDRTEEQIELKQAWRSEALAKCWKAAANAAVLLAMDDRESMGFKKPKLDDMFTSRAKRLFSYGDAQCGATGPLALGKKVTGKDPGSAGNRRAGFWFYRVFKSATMGVPTRTRIPVSLRQCKMQVSIARREAAHPRTRKATHYGTVRTNKPECGPKN